MPKEKGSFKLDSGPVNQKGEHWSGLMMLFVEIGIPENKGNPNRMTVLSNTVAALVVVESRP